MKTFYNLLGVGLIAATVNNFIWFALTYFVYLETRSVISTAFIGGIYLVVTSLSGFFLGAIVDNHKKRHAMLLSSITSLALYLIGFLIFMLSPEDAFSNVLSPTLWIFSLILLFGAIAGNIYNIAIPTLVTVLVSPERRDRANGLFGTVMGIAFAITSVASGLILGFGGMDWVLLTAIIFTVLAIVYLLFISIPESRVIHVDLPETVLAKPGKIDIRGTIKVVSSIPGLFALIFYSTFNNFLGGVFMALLDAYGLSLVSVQAWGILWGFLSLGFIFGGLIIAKKGLGKSPLKTLFLINIAMWIICVFFTIQPSIVLLASGMMIYMILVPFVEAVEQTIIQKVVPQERQGRVFGFAQSIEQAASPLTAFIIGPIAQFFFIPFMTTGRGVDLIGGWFGVGAGRGIALVFILTGIIGLIVTLIAMRSKPYRLLSEKYHK
jgi:MFS transporter, DHA3 family, multidrug efflux protein